MDPLTSFRPNLSRRDILKSSALALLPLAIPSANYALDEQQLMTANGGTDPYPIPSLDKNGSHNQPAGPNLEPSHIYHFKGRVAPEQHLYWHGYRQSGKSNSVWQSHD